MSVVFVLAPAAAAQWVVCVCVLRRYSLRTAAGCTVATRTAARAAPRMNTLAAIVRGWNGAGRARSGELSSSALA